jgi:3-hydroxyacyl-CoA dehydrogenase/enoyl-CoA hydratase/3-hydroxybutyryl-CoA epimerase
MEKVSTAMMAKKPGKEVDQSIYQLLGLSPASKLSSKVIAERSVLMMLNEAARCLHEGVIRNPRDGDIGAIFGIGFPPFLGGPFKYMDTLGIKYVVERLNQLSESDDKFKPADILVNMHKENITFYSQ